jgi:hypothetical protein
LVEFHKCSVSHFIPIHSFVYTEVGINPNKALARGTASDSDIPKNVANAKWNEVPGIWLNTVERLSWTMVGKPAAYGCKFREVDVL